MTRRKGLEPQPRCYLAAGEWPEGPLVDDAPPEAKLAQELSRRFKSAYDARGLKIRPTARKLGISVTTVHNLLHGKTWGDVITIARIEMGFGIQLWASQQNAGRSAP